MDEKWIAETLYPDYGQRFRILRTLVTRTTPFQELAIHETAAFGRMLTLDGVCQTTERDEFFYHEMMTHLPILAHGEARKVLIVGGGDGGILEEALKHRTVEKATMVEIDGAVIELSREWLPSICGRAFHDPRTELIVGDGIAFVAETAERYDVILVDSTDPMGAAEPLFGPAFYAQCRRCLAPRGILVTQNGVPFLQPDEFSGTYRHLEPLFPDAGFYFVPVPTYVGGMMALAWASLDPASRQVDGATLAARFREAAIATNYYSPEIHAAAFALPPYLAKLIG
ncbi:MAG TPA: polyamine aminopropyltransferase [Alphaproteobacteria bacterium]